jgi:hypothetical protein
MAIPEREKHLPQARRAWNQPGKINDLADMF